MQTPRRFSDAFRAAVESELPAFAPAMLRARFHLWESGSTAQMVDTLSGIRGSHGVVLKGQDQPEVAEAIDRLVAAGVPVVTYATDVPTSSRGYVGIDNHGAVVTAAYLMDQWLGSAPSDVLITLSATVFRGEGEREVGFRSALRGSGRAIVEVSDSDGITRPTSGWCSRRWNRIRGSKPSTRSAAATPPPGGVRDIRTSLQGFRCARPRRRQPSAAARRPHLGGSAQRSARRRPAGDAADTAGARRAARQAGAPRTDPGHHALQAARPVLASS